MEYKIIIENFDIKVMKDIHNLIKKDLKDVNYDLQNVSNKLHLLNLVGVIKRYLNDYVVNEYNISNNNFDYVSLIWRYKKDEFINKYNDMRKLRMKLLERSKELNKLHLAYNKLLESVK